MVVGLRGVEEESLALCLTQDGVSERCEELQLLLWIVPQGGLVIKLGVQNRDPEEKFSSSDSWSIICLCKTCFPSCLIVVH